MAPECPYLNRRHDRGRPTSPDPAVSWNATILKLDRAKEELDGEFTNKRSAQANLFASTARKKFVRWFPLRQPKAELLGGGQRASP
jgi:hypothetical protein